MEDEHADLREHLVYLLNGGGAHLSFEEAVRDVPEHLYATKPPGLPYTPWRLLEHMRLAQEDILDFCLDPNYRERQFPDDYWPKDDGPLNGSLDWRRSMAEFAVTLDAMA